MKKIIALALAALTVGCMSERPMDPGRRSLADGPASLAEALNGRVQAGPPQNCVSQRLLRGNRSVGEEAIIFQTTGSNLVYVNRPPGGCPEVRPGRAIRTRTTTTQLCRGDIVEVFDPLNGFSSGACGLGDFTPYRRSR